MIACLDRPHQTGYSLSTLPHAAGWHGIPTLNAWRNFNGTLQDSQCLPQQKAA